LKRLEGTGERRKKKKKKKRTQSHTPKWEKKKNEGNTKSFLKCSLSSLSAKGNHTQENAGKKEKKKGKEKSTIAPNLSQHKNEEKHGGLRDFGKSSEGKEDRKGGRKGEKDQGMRQVHF